MRCRAHYPCKEMIEEHVSHLRNWCVDFLLWRGRSTTAFVFACLLHAVCMMPFAFASLRDGIMRGYDCESEESKIKRAINAAPLHVHIVYSSDVRNFDGLLSSMISVSRHLMNPADCTIHLIVPQEHIDYVHCVIQCFRHALASLDAIPNAVLHEMRPLPFSVNGSQWVPATFAYIYMLDYLPIDAARAIYLDTDVIVKTDLAQLYNMHMEYTLAAVEEVGVWSVPRSHPGLLRNRDMRCSHTGTPLQDLFSSSDTPIFNAGVLLLDLNRWGALEVSQVFEALITHCPTDLGEQEYLNLALQGEFELLDWRWNLQGLCLNLRYDQRCLDEAKVLHFTGVGKPWHALHGCAVHADLMENRSRCPCPVLKRSRGQLDPQA